MCGKVLMTLHKNECPVFAVKLYTILKEHSPEEYWRAEASVRLDVITAAVKR